MDKWSSGFVARPGYQLHYHRTGGDRPPVVLSHGLTDNGLCWTRVARALQDDFDVIMVDARGHGQSSGLSPETTDEGGRDLVAVIEALSLPSPALLGHSIGARNTARAASALAGAISKVILEDPPFLPEATEAERVARDQGFRKQVAQFAAMSVEQIMAFGKQQTPGWHPEEFEQWASGKQQVDENVVAHFESQPWQDTIRQIAVPTLLVYGQSDLGGLVTPESAAEAQALNANIAGQQIMGAGHNIHREQFEQFLAAVRAFLL